MQCALHPERDASGLCHVCLKAVCVLCMSPLILDVTCTSCAAPLLAAKKRRARLGTVGAVTVLGLVVAAGAWAYQNYELPPDQVVTRYDPAPPDSIEIAKQQHAAELVEIDKQEPAPAPVVQHDATSAPVVRVKHEPAPDWGKYAGKIRSLIASLQKEPCDRTKALELSQLLLRAHDNHGVLTHDEAFFAACGDMSRLRWDMYEAHKNLSEWDLAIAEATKLIETDRTDPDFWWWRGRVEVMKGDLEAAVSDFRQSVDLCPRCTGAWDLADALEKLGRPCDALPPLETMLRLNENNQHVDTVRVQARIDDLKARGNCK
jgi:aspartyl protease family protein